MRCDTYTFFEECKMFLSQNSHLKAIYKFVFISLNVFYLNTHFSHLKSIYPQL